MKKELLICSAGDDLRVRLCLFPPLPPVLKRSQGGRTSHNTLQKQTKMIRGASEKKGFLLQRRIYSRLLLSLQTFVIQISELEVGATILCRCDPSALVSGCPLTPQGDSGLKIDLNS